MRLKANAVIEIRLPAEILHTYQEIARLSGVKIEKVLLVTVAMKIVADKNKESLP